MLKSATVCLIRFRKEGVRIASVLCASSAGFSMLILLINKQNSRKMPQYAPVFNTVVAKNNEIFFFRDCSVIVEARKFV